MSDAPSFVKMIAVDASPEAFAALEPVQALIGALVAEISDKVQLMRIKAGREADGVRFQALDDVRHMIRSAWPEDALAALAAREAAAERRGWLAGMERAAGVASPWSIEASEAIRAEMEKR